MPARLRYPEYAPEGISSLRSFEHYLNTGTSLPAVLLELVRLRVSQQNGCEFCTGLHAAELRKHNEPETRIAAVEQWRESQAFTAREKAAFAWAESLTTLDTHASDADYSAVSEFFREKDLVDLTLAIGSINLWNRLGVAFRPSWNPEKHAQKKAQAEPKAGDSGEDSRPVVGDDGGKVAQD